MVASGDPSSGKVGGSVLLNSAQLSSTAQPLHTDGAYNLQPPSVGLLFCQAQAKAHRFRFVKN